MKKIILSLFLCGLTGIYPMHANEPVSKPLEEASFGGGCFWCVEVFFLRLKGVESVVSGYQGGRVANPSYREVTTGRTGHAEVVRVKFDPAVIGYQDLLEVFFSIHDPTTLNRQGNDVGTQYRSVIFTYNEEQNKAAKGMISKLTALKTFDDPIVTEVREAPPFYEAEDYHQDYFNRNPNAPYCRLVIAPKLRGIQIRPELLRD